MAHTHHTCPRGDRPHPPAPFSRGEGGNNLNINALAHLPWEMGWGEVKEREGEKKGVITCVSEAETQRKK